MAKQPQRPPVRELPKNEPKIVEDDDQEQEEEQELEEGVIEKGTSPKLKRPVKVFESEGKGRKKCEKCGRVIGAGSKECLCGHQFERKDRADIQEGGNDAVFDRATTLLVEVMVFLRGYKSPKDALEDLERTERLVNAAGSIANAKKMISSLSEMGGKSLVDVEDTAKRQ